MSLFLFLFAAFFSGTTFPCIPPVSWQSISFCTSLSLSLSFSFHVSFFTLPPSFPFFTLPCSPALCSPSCIVGTANGPFRSGLQKQLDRRREPLETCQAVICPSPFYPPPPAHLCFSSSTHFNPFFFFFTPPPFIHPPPLSLSLSLLLYLSPLLTLLHLFACQLLFSALFLQNLSHSKTTVQSFFSIIVSKTKLGFHEAKL